MASYFNVSIYSALSEFPTEKRFPKEIKIKELKEKLELITGADHKTMTIELSIEDKPAVNPDDNEQTLAHYIGEISSTDTTVKLVVKDDSVKDLLAGDVPKVTISEEKYASRPDNVRNFIKEMKEKQAQQSQ